MQRVQKLPWRKAISEGGRDSCEYSEHIPEFIVAKFLNGLESSMNTIPMLNIWTPPPDM